MSVSVVIPAYNRARRLPAAIDSVLRQGVADVEVIVVDDGSQDDTRAVVARYGDRVRYIHQSNAGVGSARNTGLRHATGEFIAFLDSDDRWLDFKLSLQLALFAARPDVGLIFSDFVIERADGRLQIRGAERWAGRPLDFPEMTRICLPTPAGAEAGTPEVECWVGPMYGQLLSELPILTSSVIVRRQALDDSTWFAERIALFEDWEFFARVARRWHLGYVAIGTTVNVGHLDPGRVSRCSTLDRAASYQSLVERVWLRDDEFIRSKGELVRIANGRALLAIAREALLANRIDTARDALARWRAARLHPATRMGGGVRRLRQNPRRSRAAAEHPPRTRGRALSHAPRVRVP